MLGIYNFFEVNIFFAIIFNILLLSIVSSYCIIRVRFYNKILYTKKSINIIHIIMFLIASVSSVIVSTSFLYSFGLFILSTLLIVLLLNSIFDITLKQGFFFALDFILVPFFSKTIILSFIFLIYKNSIYNISQYLGYIHPIISFLLANLIVYILDIKKINYTYWRIFIAKKDKVKLMLLIQIYIIIFGFSAFLAYGSDLSIVFWRVVFMCFIYIIFIYKLLLNYILRDSAIIIFKEDRDLLEQQMKWQMENYRMESSYVSYLKKFKHDFKFFVYTLEELLKQDKTDEAITFLTKISEKSEEYIGQYKEFSNNQFVQAILNNAYKNAIKNQIAFEARVYFPDKININELDLCRIFSNLINNAIEATAKIETEKREIKIYGYTKKQSLLLKITNSFNGEIKFEKNKIITSKSNKFEHGLGIEVIKETLEKYDGFMEIEYDKEKFVTKVYLPL